MSEVRQIEITEGINSWGQSSFKSVREGVKGLRPGGKLRVVVNSFGGSVLEGILIYNFLKGHPAEVEVHIPAYAMSAATVIAAAGDRVSMAETGYFMIHNPWTLAVGDQNEMESTRDLLEMFASDIAGIYAKRTGMTLDKIRDMMDEETWLTSAEALEMGFVDELTPAATFEASLPEEVLASFNNVPQALRQVPEIKNEPNPAKMNKTIWEKIGALLAGNSTPETEITENEAALMRSVELATGELETANTRITSLEADLAQAQADLQAAQERITELEAMPAAEHTNGRSDGDLSDAQAKPWEQNPLYLRARKAAGKL
jgi:ATP-dependent Clp protease, protease subunit